MAPPILPIFDCQIPELPPTRIRDPGCQCAHARPRLNLRIDGPFSWIDDLYRYPLPTISVSGDPSSGTSSSAAWLFSFLPRAVLSSVDAGDAVGVERSRLSKEFMAKCVLEMGYWPDRRENKRHLEASFRVPLKASSKGVSVATMMRIPWTWAPAINCL